MRKVSFGKRLISMLLALVMILGMAPVADISGWFTKAQAAGSGPIYVLAGGDFQAGDNGQADHYYSRINMGNILDKIKENYPSIEMNGFIFVGDYDGDTHNDSNANAGVAAMMEEVSERFNTLNHNNSYLIEGNHETGAVSGIDATGGYDCDGYAVYLINETDFCERQAGKSVQIQTVADNLKTWLNNKIGEGYEAPIFVATHTPLGYTTRTYTNGDSLYGKYVFDVLNDAAANGLNIIFMHGHDHAYGADNYLGGEAIYLPVGDKINICVPGDQTKWTEETLNFTYMNAGYVGYYNENYYNVKSYEAEKLTMTVFKIENNQVTVERWSKDGLYNLKSAGREGFYGVTSGNGTTCANIGLSYNTTVYNSPQTITLRASDADEMGTIGAWVGVEAETPADDVTTSNKGWVELIAPVPGTPAVPGTPESTKYVYTLDTDGTVTDKANAEQGYLIVGSGNNNYAMTDSLGATGVTVTNNAITLDAQPDYEWWITADGKITDGTNYLKFTGSTSWGSPSGSVSVVTNASQATAWEISHSQNGQYTISYDYSYSSWGSTRTATYYLRYNSNAFSVTSSSNTVRLFSGTEVTTPATEGTPAVPGTNGTYGKIVGDLTYKATAGMTADQAMALVKAGIDGYYYEAMSTPGTNVTGTKVEDSVLTWEWVDTFNGNVAGDYEVAIKYGDFLLGTAEVVVPATKTYYIAEGNGFYLVDMNTTADNAMATVKAGVTVYSATDAAGTGKTAISDDDVTWKWVDTYNGADSGPYTVEILKDGTSLGIVEVKVNIKYETGINSDWTEVGETEATGGQYTYTLDTDGIDSDGQYIIVAESQALALHTSGSSAATAVSVTISSDGKTLTTDTRDYEYYWNSTYGFTRDGYNGLYQSGYYIYLGTKADSYMPGVINNGDGTYCLYDNVGTKRTLYYGTRDGNTRFLVSEESNYTDVSVRLYKYTGTTGGTPGGKIYALIEGNTVYTVDQGTSATKALAAVKAGITGYTASDANGTGKTEINDSELTWKWKNTYASMVTGSYWVEISYQGKVLGTVEVKVEPGVINNYPEYPDEGAVKVNKTGIGIDFQSSGIAQIEVSASGVPIKKGADVIVMVDTSSSMNTCITHGTRNCSNAACQGKYRSHAFEASLKNLIAQFKTPGDDGQMLDMRVAIADFNGFDKDTDKYPWSWNPKDILVDDVEYDATNYGTVYTGANAGTRDLTASAFVNVADLKDSYSFTYHSGTNYDYAFDVIYQLATAIQAANAEERDLYVIFMSDGAPMQYNYFHSNGRSDLLQYYLQGQITQTSSLSYRYDGQESNSYQTATGYGAFKSGANTAYYNPEGKHWMAEAIKGDPNTDYKVIRKGIEGADANGFITIKGLGAKMFSIAFCPAVDQHTPVVAMTHVLETIASEQTGTTQYYYNVNTADELANAFGAIGSEIAYAAYNARFVDQMGDSYNLQMSTSNYSVVDGTTTTDKTITPKIEIIQYDIYTRQDYLNGTITEDKIGDRKGTYKILETVTFSADGKEAYSDQINGGKTNILADGTQAGYVKGVIYAKTFLYNTNTTAVAVEGVSIPTDTKADGTTTGSTNQLPSETFYWKLGTVQTTELAMRYYVYLEGSMEGTREAGSYPTNEFATLYYDNYLNNPCKKDTVSPVMAWKEANVSYAFYLVDENGNIIVNQTTGLTGSFANKIAVTNPVVYETIKLNNLDQIRSIDIASLGVLPEGYTLYDYNGTNGATYTITINSNTTGSWKITSVKDKATTYVMNYDKEDPSAYSNNKANSTVGHDYTHTVVWFAVVWKVQALPDSVVVDYGLPVDISVLTNDMFGDNGKLAGVGAYSDSLNLSGHDTTLASGFGDTYKGTYGTAKADASTGKVRYTLNTMQMNGYEKFAYAVNYTGENAGYYYDTITVIPATTIYYEEGFITYSGSNTEWKDAVENYDGSSYTQDEDRPGQYALTDANNIYGYDHINLGMSTYSLGNAKKVHVDANSYATATFSFYGTGFDVISMTSNTTGTIAVSVKNASGTAVANKVVNTYYGYTYNEETDAWEATPDVDKSMYQVPVLQIEELPYGKYDVTITATYISVADKTTAKGYDLYLDAIRIYDPANDGASDGSDDKTIENAYAADGEGWPSYIELRNKIITAGSFDDIANDALTTDMEGLVFIDGDASIGDAQIADYKNYGPNNEVYLAPGQRVAFILSTPENIKNVHIGIKSADGKEGAYTITNIAKATNSETNVTAGDYYNAKTGTIDTTTDMYYDLTAWKGDIIVISNTGDRYNKNGVISLTNIKSTYKSDPNAAVTVGEDDDTNAVEQVNETMVYMTAPAAMLTLRALNTPEVEKTPEETVPEETTPEETVPEETTPEETVPEETTPEETVPEETVPEETTPEETTPEETTPEETTPEETVPEETTPEETVPEEDPAPTDTDTGIIKKLVELFGKLIDKLFGWLFN